MRHYSLRHLGYLEAGSNDAVATGYDPLLSEAPKLTRTLAAYVTQRTAFGERAGVVQPPAHRWELLQGEVRPHAGEQARAPQPLWQVYSLFLECFETANFHLLASGLRLDTSLLIESQPHGGKPLIHDRG